MKSILAVIGIFWAAIAHADPGPRIEVAFVLDSTGSMGSYINQARERIRSIAKDLAEGTPAPLVRFALVRFRDKTDAYLTQKNDFTRDVGIMAKWLDATTAKGGGDTPEAVLEGLDVAVRKLSWSQERNVVRLIYLVGDAPPQHYKHGPTVYSVAQEALAKGIVIHSIACGGIGRRGRFFFDQLARLSEGRTYDLSRHRRLPRRHTSGVAVTKTGLKEAISGSARAYSSSVGVRFSDVGKSAPFETVAHVSAHDTTGLLGAHVRYVSDSTTWSDVWSAHVSILTEPDLSAPIIDFHKSAVVILGGQDAGVELVAVKDHSSHRVLQVRRSSNGVRMYRLPSSRHPIVIRWSEEEKS